VSHPWPAASPLVHPRSARVHWRGPVHAVAGHAFPAGGSGAAPEPGRLSCADVVLDQVRWTVHRAGTPVELSPTEFRLLACLLRDQGRVLSKAELLRQVWGPDFTGQPQVVDTYISYLRRKLDSLGPPLIRTRRGQGYVLQAPA
jgi:two-component system, OmpR family, response regulator